MSLKTNLLKATPLLLSASLVVGCGGGSEGGSSLSGTTSAVTSKAGEVAGPLDALQGPLSDMVIAPLADAANGTPLAPVLNCVDEAVVINLLDVVDSIALAAQNGAESGDPAAALQDAAANVQASLTSFAENTVAMLQGIAGGAGCAGAGGVPALGLEDLGGAGGLPSLGGLGGLDGLPIPTDGTGTPLDAVIDQLTGLANAGGGEQMGLEQLTALVDQFVAEFNNAFAMLEQQIPAEALNAPVFGGVLALVDDAVNQLDDVVAALASMEPIRIGNEASTLLALVLNNLLTGVVPVDALEDALGSGSPVGDPLSDGADQLAAALADGLELLLSGLPIGDVIPADALGMGGSPLDTVLGPLMGLASGGAPAVPGLPSGGGSPLDALPLDLILAPLLELAGAEEPLDALVLVNPVLEGVAPFAAILTGSLSGNGVLGVVTGPVLDGLEPVTDIADEAGLNATLQSLVGSLLNQALGAVL